MITYIGKFVTDGKFVTANIVARTDYLQQDPDVIKKLLVANVNETSWINNHTDAAIKAFNTEFQNLTGKTINENELKQAWSRIQFTYDPLKLSLFQGANAALRSRILDLSLCIIYY